MKRASDPEGWLLWDSSSAGTWPSLWAPIRYRPLDERRMAILAEAPAAAGNMYRKIHGAFLAGLAEQASGIWMRHAAIQCVTISLAFDYPASGVLDRPIEGWVEKVRETGRLFFARLQLSQGDDVLIHGTATLRKFSA